MMLESGAYTAIASHDLPVVDHALKSLESRGLDLVRMTLVMILPYQGAKEGPVMSFNFFWGKGKHS